MYALSPDLRGEAGAEAGDGTCACGIPTGPPTERGQCPRPIIRLCRSFLRAMRAGGGGGGGEVITYCFHCFYFAFLLSVDSVVDSVDMVSDIVSSASTIPGSIINSSLLRLLILFLHVQWGANITWRTWNATAKIKVLFDVGGWQFCEALRIKK